MKSLMPLALSPSCSSLWSSSSAEEPVGERVDDYFPELLARDLELSTRVFTSKRMTAGMPISTLSLDDRGRQRSCRMMPSLPYLAASARVKSLGPIEERSSRVSFLNPQGLPVLDDTSSDLDSRSTAQASEDTLPPSIRPRESYMTMATSLASTSWKPSMKSPARRGGARESSWIDGDSDGEGHDDDDEGLRRSNLESPTPRPPTPPESDRESGVPGSKIDVRGHWGYNEAPLHRKSHSVSGSSPATSRRKLSAASLDVPLRPASTAGVRGNEARESIYGRLPSVLTKPNGFTNRQEEFRPRHARKLTGGSLMANRRSLHINVVTEPSPVSEDYSDLEEELMTPPRLQHPYHPLSSHPVEIAPPPPRPPLRNVQSWLNGSLQPMPRSLQNEDLTKVVPLPPDAMETLRVSIACFPETMLLSSSLTIETIRTYSRKVRQPSIELFRNLPIRSPSPESPTQANKKSLWRKVVPYKKGWEAPEPKQRLHHSGHNSIDSTTSCPPSPPKPWESLKHVFGCYSDYICDALYAHILAYNYIAALASRNSQPHQKVQRGASIATRDSQQSQEEIPKKAASLLGLAGAGDAAASSFSRLTRRLGTPLGSWTKEEMITSQPSASANHENMQQGLLKCIYRLVATAKLIAETGSGDETTIKEEVEEMDMLFVRSLCEIVRMAEEAS
ncbi:hypothetical protein HIM_04677 [Hirsutella minnesotensis 3608]|uniref:Uncharacterized protein n=1 Tax=Hirsutella minnesotensis 3608 TaxID=1043627 RepID=A0A0F7ZV21_9HYPO|nr:hypothetical protein HIM_04677 [Hirsutella minnesotensis 3608]